MNWKKIGTVLGCVVGVFAVIQGADTLNSKYASAEAVRNLEERLTYTNDRLEYKIKEDQLYSTKRRLWQIEDRKKKPGNEFRYINEERELKHTIDRLEKELETTTKEKK